jgi:hypothetical protein
MENYIIKLLWNMQSFMEKSSHLTIKNLQIFASRNYLLKILEETNIEYNAKSKVAYDSDWEKNGIDTCNEKFATLQRGYKLLREFNSKQIEEFYANLQGHAMTQSGTRRRTMSTTGFMFLTKENFTNFLKMTNDIQSNIIYEVIDFNESKFIGANRFRCIAQALVTEGDLLKKVNQIFSIKSEGKSEVEPALALEFVDMVEDVLNFINQYMFSFNFKLEMYMLKTDLIKICKNGKLVTFSELFECLKQSILSEMITEINGYLTFVEEYDKVAKKDDAAQLEEWKEKYHECRKELAQKDLDFETFKFEAEAQYFSKFLVTLGQNS